MPPNPRDHLRPDQDVPLDRVQEIVYQAMRGIPVIADLRLEAAKAIVERLGYFRLLAHDVQGQRCAGDFHTTPHRSCILR